MSGVGWTWYDRVFDDMQPDAVPDPVTNDPTPVGLFVSFLNSPFFPRFKTNSTKMSPRPPFPTSAAPPGPRWRTRPLERTPFQRTAVTGVPPNIFQSSYLSTSCPIHAIKEWDSMNNTTRLFRKDGTLPTTDEQRLFAEDDTSRGSGHIAKHRTPLPNTILSHGSPSAPCTPSTNEMSFEDLELREEFPIRAHQNLSTCVTCLER
ncbi:hypothetical protein K443DRAFT_7591 [Laccaria amethystina LaAM-08-1]|uniref:Unplaced genomic scaffold K443scaffold_88, whole genome shotgun sequence n=1 Tax=Laccaria amethystina LaAM-08-1 TaxID=1095629 RepID=A0A0C9XXH5_9AGAR|nr:hypothetical protein K443DRAFT_7591 [Laccaria amethystina LaAM-08-1]